MTRLERAKAFVLLLSFGAVMVVTGGLLRDFGLVDTGTCVLAIGALVVVIAFAGL